MPSSAIISAVFLLSSSIVDAAPTAGPTPIRRFEGETSGRYIVTLKADADKANTFEGFSSLRFSGSFNITHEWDSSFFNGFSGEFSDDALDTLRASDDIESIEEDGILTILSTVTQSNAPWGISRLSQDAPVSGSSTTLNHPYLYDSTAGAGVDIFIVDTGIRTTHLSFGGRAIWGATFGGYANADGNGHGTHLAGTAGSAGFGVAKAARLIAVKVLDDSGSGSVSDIISGLNYAATTASTSGKPSIVNLSLGGSISTALDNAVVSLVNAGLHVVVAAGNSATDASNFSPARVASAITVGSTDITDSVTSTSNYGAVLDIFAPGWDIYSTWNTGDTATNTISGSSSATAHVTGLTAYLIGHYGNSSPAAISSLLTQYALVGVLSNVPAGTVNLLARNDI